MSKQKAKKDYDRDGKLESPEKEYKDLKGRAIKLSKLTGNKKRKSKKRVVKEAADISSFITAISTKKYALAHKYLKQVIEDKIAKRISSSLNEPLF
jgi:hypothetical protein